MKKIKPTNIKEIKTREDDSETSILEEARKRASLAYSYAESNFIRAEEDLAFIFGEQYTEDELEQKNLDNRIAMTFNKLPQYINRVVGSQRATVQTIKISPTGTSTGRDEPEFQTTKGNRYKLSMVLTDLIRDIEYQSNAVSHYKKAFRHAVEGGFGYIRVYTDYQEDGFDQEIKITSIKDRWSVLLDPNTSEPDNSDMNFAFISERMSNEEFSKRYPDSSREAITSNYITEANTGYWYDDKTITVTEYFRREPITKKICALSDGSIVDKESIKDIIEELEERGVTIVKERNIRSHKVIWCKITAGSILEEEREIPCTTIPIVEVTGRTFDMRNKTEKKGLINDGKDGQTLLNVMMSNAAEAVDDSPNSPFIATDKAIEGYETIWAEANTTRYSVLPYRKGEERPQRDNFSKSSAPELSLVQAQEAGLQTTIGIRDEALGGGSRDQSGKAIKARQAEADTGTYEFIDNYKMAIQRVGMIITEMIPFIYDSERTIRIRGEDGTSSLIEINKTITDEQTGKDIVIHDLDFGKYTASISTGSEYGTKREEEADQILSLMQVSPQIAQVGSDLLVDSMGFNNSDVLASRLEKMIPPNLLSKDKQEELQQETVPQQPSSEQIQAESKLQELQIQMQIKQQEMEAKLQLEQIKLETAKVNLQIKEAELNYKENMSSQEKKDEDEEEKTEKQEIAKQFVSNIK